MQSRWSRRRKRAFRQMRWASWPLLTLAAVALLPASVRGQSEGSHFSDSVGLCGQLTGWSCAIDSSTAVIGSPGLGWFPLDFGGAFVLEYVPVQGWSEALTLLASDGQSTDRFGEAVDISGDWILVGAQHDNPGPTLATQTAGSAYLFQHQGNTWVEAQKLVASDAGSNERFGWSVSIDGDLLVVGARNDNGIATNAGAAYIFENQGGFWSETVKLTASDAQPYAFFGQSVDISGTRVAVGAPGVNRATGASYVFEKQAGIWVETQKLLPSDPQSSHIFGTAVALEGKRVFVGAPFDDDAGSSAGAVYVFALIGGIWTEVHELHSMLPQAFACFGDSLDVSVDRLVVGEPLASAEADRSGAVNVFQRDGPGWQGIARLYAPGAQPQDELGMSVAISGEHVVAGAPNEDLADPSNALCDTGGAWIFELPLFARGYCFGVGCPCGNDDPSRGCASLDHEGALLAACGTGSVAADDAAFEGRGLPAGQPALLFRAANAVNGGAGLPFGDGLRCAGGQAKRLGVRFAAVDGTASWGPGLAATASWLPGETWRMQAWYRDPQGSSCGATFNTTNGVEALLEP